MIRVTDYKGATHYVAPLHIVHIKEASTSSQWHGIRSIVKLDTGEVIESSDRADELFTAISFEGGE